MDALIFSACISSREVIKPRFYILEGKENLAPLERVSGDRRVAIQDVLIPQYLDKPQIVVKSSGHELELMEYHQWGGNFRKNITRVLQQNLETILGSSVFSAPNIPSEGITHRIKIEILVFEFHSEEQEVYLTAKWSVINKGGSNSDTQFYHSDLMIPVSDSKNIAHIVSAMSDCLATMSQEMANAIE